MNLNLIFIRGHTHIVNNTLNANIKYLLHYDLYHLILWEILVNIYFSAEELKKIL